MSEKLKERLNEELNRIIYEQKKSYGYYLQLEDVQMIVETLKKIDMEISPLLDILLESLTQNFDDNHFFVTTKIEQLLKYYRLLENDDIMNIRHKLMFTESKKMVNSPFLNESKIQEIREVFDHNGIYKKL
jgi:hypothetical protein